MQAQPTRFWLRSASAIVIGFGVLVALAAFPATAGPTLLLTDLIFWPFDGAQSLGAPETRLLCAIGGGLMAGWGVLLWLVATQLYPREPELARTMILYSTGTWFVIDSLGSIAAGAPLNALLNVGFLLAFVLPLRRLTVRAPS
jgi:hypothetical protein